MNPAGLATLATFGATWAILAAGHNLADHVTGQTDKQALTKGAPTPKEIAEGASPRRGWGANLRHVAAYHATLITIGGLAWAFLPLAWSPLGIVLALAWSAGTHAFLDRRWPVRWILRHTGSAGFAELAGNGLNGMWMSDQALHGAALLIAAIILAVTK